MRKLLISAITLGLVIVPSIVLDQTPATAQTSIQTATDPTGPDFTPSGNKAKKYMLNVLGRVLGKAMPDSWRAEQIANEYQYNHSWEALEMEFGTDPANPDYSGSPDSYQDYVLKKTEQDIKGGTGGKKLAVPATATAKLVKGVGAASVAMIGLPIGTAIGNGVTSLFGFDPSDSVCPQSDSFVKGILGFFTGADCDSWKMTAQAEAAANSDVIGAGAWGAICTPTATWCAQVTDQLTYLWKPSSAWHTTTVICLQQYVGAAANPPTGWVFSVQVGPYTGDAPSDSVPHPAGGTFDQSLTSGRMMKSGAAYTPDPANCGPTSNAYFQLDISKNGVKQVYEPLQYPVAMGLRNTSTGELVGTVEPDFDPARQLTCSILADNGQTYTATSLAYNESSGEIAAPECPALPDGVGPANVTVSDNKGNELYNQEVNPEYSDWWDTYPECRTGACKLDLVKVDGSYPVSCFDLVDECADWFTDPDRADNYECHYGIHTVDIDECFVYSGLWQPGRIEIGAPYSDPMTGDWSGGQNAPTPDQQALGQSIQDPTTTRSCNGLASAGFDPVAWVMRPIQCALEWAFVPRPAVLALSGEQLTDRFGERAPGQLAAMIGGWSFTPNMTGCSKTVELPVTAFDVGEEDITLWNMCEGSPYAFLGTLARTLTTVGFGVLVFLATKRAVGGMVDYQ